jgi:hypothetical protein
MLPAAEKRISALTSGEEIFSLTVPFAAVASAHTRLGAKNRIRGFFPKIDQFASAKRGLSGQERISLANSGGRKPRWA